MEDTFDKPVMELLVMSNSNGEMAACWFWMERNWQELERMADSKIEELKEFRKAKFAEMEERLKELHS